MLTAVAALLVSRTRLDLGLCAIGYGPRELPRTPGVTAGGEGALQEIDPLEPIELELDEEEDGAVAGWLYDDKPLQWTKFMNGPSYRSWNLPLPVVRLRRPAPRRRCRRCCCRGRACDLGTPRRASERRVTSRHSVVAIV